MSLSGWHRNCMYETRRRSETDWRVGMTTIRSLNPPEWGVKSRILASKNVTWVIQAVQWWKVLLKFLAWSIWIILSWAGVGCVTKTPPAQLKTGKWPKKIIHSLCITLLLSGVCYKGSGSVGNPLIYPFSSYVSQQHTWLPLVAPTIIHLKVNKTLTWNQLTLHQWLFLMSLW